jgi:hypothetical protein
MTPWLVHELPTLLLEVNTRSKKSESPSAMPTSHPKGTPRTGLCQQSNRSAARRNGNWKMAPRDQRPKPAPQGSKDQKSPVRDWGAPLSWRNAYRTRRRPDHRRHDERSQRATEPMRPSLSSSIHPRALAIASTLALATTRPSAMSTRRRPAGIGRPWVISPARR